MTARNVWAEERSSWQVVLTMPDVQQKISTTVEACGELHAIHLISYMYKNSTVISVSRSKKDRSNG